LSACERPCRVEPSDTSRDDSVSDTCVSQGPCRVSPFPPEHVNASSLPELEVPSTGEACARSLSRAREERCRRWPAMAAAARVHRRSKTSTRPLPVRCRERLPGRVRSSGFCKWMFPRARLRTTRASRTTGERWGRLPLSIESRLSIGQPPKVRRVRGREHQASTLPTVIAHGGDFAPTPIASGTSCRGYRLLPCPE
jgi:hypothetical protein